MGKIANVVGDMPFAGRAIVENTYFWAHSEQTTIGGKIKKCAAAAGFLAVFGLLHSVQARMGLADLRYDVSQFQADPSAGNGLECAISGLYTLANTAVTYTQLQLSGKTVLDAAVLTLDKVQGNDIEPRRPFEVEHVKPQEIAFTLGGQMLFAAFNDIHH